LVRLRSFRSGHVDQVVTFVQRVAVLLPVTALN
jgi:hypothetical protein